MVDSSEVGIMEEREEVMVSSVDEEVKPIFRVAHFLKPTTKKLPFLPSRLKISCSSLKVQFRGGFSYMKGWSKWVDELKPLHQQMWKKAGIFEGIIASTFKIYRHSDLILALAERWCLETNTFILPWGEATITLEDMVILGGFSVLGHSVLNQTKDSVDIEKALCEVHKDIRARKTNVGHHAWMEHFAGRGDHLEHVAFLTLWLSRYVLPARSCLFVDRALFPIAIYLSQGIPIALAPAVLASIYRDMSLLQQLIVSSAKNHAPSDSRCIEDKLNPNLRAPFSFIIYIGEPRVARWHKVKKLNHVDPSSGIDYAAECFLWRPYAVDIGRICGGWRKHGREIMTFARLVRASELVGMDCVEQYNPHRVSMQFGFDQDVPGCVNHASDHIPKIAWTNYNRPIKDVKLYIPSRFIESDVSRRYLEWWKNQNVAVQHEKMNAIVCCGFLQKCEMIVVESSSDDDDNIPISVSLRKRKLMKKEITVPVNNQELFLNMQSQSSSASNDGTSRARETLVESKPISEKFEDSNGKSDEDGDGPYVVKEMVPLETKNNNDKGGCKLNLPDGIELASDGPELLRTNPAKTLQMSEASVVTPKVTATCTNITEGNMVMRNINNHEKGSSRFEMIDILKLEMKIRNLESINAGKGPIFRTK
ncbi:hypothetical protein R3W88_020791 [Solanum pinnatisectum]|uniref:Aminotransferase-like plant mobile domain-containing protein n=1 Tax=Solanum pinnatisectum TaxID=50273 RepID=A0AAV9KNK1_9SOLN|nr:hypothetical protein R3W88_020791 [Solanum pinnatisectum]